MSVFQLNINTDGPAFQEDAREEVARILQEAASNVLARDSLGRIRDSKGNRVGFWTFKA